MYNLKVIVASGYDIPARYSDMHCSKIRGDHSIIETLQ